MTQNTLGITGAAPIWHDVMAAAYTLFKYPNSYWPVPGGVGRYQINGDTGLAPYQGMSGNYADWFIDGEVPSIS
jgi:membrane carboxypeptidase/penicillin-binding protein